MFLIFIILAYKYLRLEKQFLEKNSKLKMGFIIGFSKISFYYIYLL